MLVFRLMALAMWTAAVTGCSQSSARCSEAFNRALSGSAIRLWELEEVRYPQVETRLIAEVDRCYRPEQPGAFLLFTDEWRDKHGNRYLGFDIKGTSDIAFVAVVDRSGSIVGVSNANTNY